MSETEPNLRKLEEEAVIDTLARTIWGEARHELVRVKEAVAAAIMNRVARAEARGGHWWGSTVMEVCLAPRQFGCWDEADPRRSAMLRAAPTDRQFASALRIARRAVRRGLKDRTNGATHYHRATKRPWWARGRTPCAAVGDFVFYRNIG